MRLLAPPTEIARRRPRRARRAGPGRRLGGATSAGESRRGRRGRGRNAVDDDGTCGGLRPRAAGTRRGVDGPEQQEQERRQAADGGQERRRRASAGPVGHVAQRRVAARLARVDLDPLADHDAPVLAFARAVAFQRPQLLARRRALVARRVRVPFDLRNDMYDDD